MDGWLDFLWDRLPAFLATLRQWDGVTPPFSELIMTATELSAALDHHCDDGGRLVPYLARRTKLLESDIRGWFDPTRRPLEFLARLLVREMHAYLSRRFSKCNLD